MKRIALGMIRIYQGTVSRVMLPQCRYSPTCSEFTVEAIGRYGVLRGIWMGSKRIRAVSPISCRRI